MSDEWRVYMERIVSRMLLKRDIGAFRDPIDWEGTDYLKVVSRPMDLTTVSNRLLDDMYNSREECIQDVRLIWSNAKLYNKAGTKIHDTACQMEESFEVMLKNAISDEDERYEERLGSASPPTLHVRTSYARPVSVSAMHTFITNCHRIRREELRDIILKLESLCPECIQKNGEENKLNIEVDLISPAAFRALNGMIRSYLSYLGAAIDAPKTVRDLSDGGKRKAPADTGPTGSNNGSSKTARISSSSGSSSRRR